jgi:replication factor A1
MATAESKFVSISDLTRGSTQWTIQARVIEKDSRTYTNANGDGKLFTVIVADASGDIRITGFNEVYDTHYDKLTLGAVYEISGGSFKTKNAKFNNTSHELELTLNRWCTLKEVNDADNQLDIPELKFEFVPIEQLEQLTVSTKVDVIGVVVECADPIEFTAQSGKVMKKRLISIADVSGKGIDVAIFGEPTQTLASGDVVAIKEAKVDEYNSKSLTVWTDASVVPNPKVDEAKKIADWWNEHGKNQGIDSLSYREEPNSKRAKNDESV